MKNLVAQFTLTVVAVIALTFIMGYTRPAAEEPKEYVVVFNRSSIDRPEKFEEIVKQKLSEGWHLQGGPTWNYGSGYCQAMTR